MQTKRCVKGQLKCDTKCCKTTSLTQKGFAWIHTQSKLTYTKLLAPRLHKPVPECKVPKTVANYNVIN